ncbi:MAG: hypothetical protein ACRESK_04105 [Gammaproteobacteria bacterium]
MMSLIMRSGRSPESKKAFYSIVENDNIDWSFRDGVARFVP